MLFRQVQIYFEKEREKRRSELETIYFKLFEKKTARILNIYRVDRAYNFFLPPLRVKFPGLIREQKGRFNPRRPDIFWHGRISSGIEFRFRTLAPAAR